MINRNTILWMLLVVVVSSCQTEVIQTYKISSESSEGGTISPSLLTVDESKAGLLTVIPDTNYEIDTVEGCGGTLDGTSFSTSAIFSDCTVSAEFKLQKRSVETNLSVGGSIQPEMIVADHGTDASFELIPDGDYRVGSVIGCDGTLDGDSYNIPEVTADCELEVTFEVRTHAEPSVTLSAMKQLNISWRDLDSATHYRILQNPDGMSGFTQQGDDITAGVEGFSTSVSLFSSQDTEFLLQTCTDSTCVDSEPSGFSELLNNAIGFVKPDVNDSFDSFGAAPRFSQTIISETIAEGGSEISLSSDGQILVVGAMLEDGDSTGSNGNASSNLTENSGAAYIFTYDGTQWLQSAYLKPSSVSEEQHFGNAVAISGDGSTIAISAVSESSGTGAVYVFTLNNNEWAQQARLTASNAESGDAFGSSLAITENGNILAIGARNEDSSSRVVNGSKTSNDAINSGAVYVFSRTGVVWSEEDYLKPSNTRNSHGFGYSVDINGAGDKLAVGAIGDVSSSTGVNGSQDSGFLLNAGAVYVFDSSSGDWVQEAYIKASNTDSSDDFGSVVSLDQAGDTLAVGAPDERSNAIGIGGNQLNNDRRFAGAVYVFQLNGGDWAQEAYIKASHNGFGSFGHSFGSRLSLSNSGDTIAASLHRESSDNVGITNNSPNSEMAGAGAAAIFSRNAGVWSQKTLVKSSNPNALDYFGSAISLSGDGQTLAVSAGGESSASNANQADNSNSSAGAVYLY